MKEYKYKFTSIDMRTCDLSDMMGMSKQIFYSSMLKNCDIHGTMNKIIPDLFPKNRGKYFIIYYSSFFRQQRCYYLMLHGVLYVFLKETD